MHVLVLAQQQQPRHAPELLHVPLLVLAYVAS
jgi:hypothetical protein